MNRKQQSMVLAGLLAMALAGCGTMRGGGDDMGTGSTGSGTGSSGMMGSGSMGSGTSGTMGSSSTGSPDTTGAIGGTGATSTTGATGGTSAIGASETGGGTMTAPAQSQATPGAPASMNGVVVSIDVVPRTSVDPGSAVGTSGTAGQTGASMGEEAVYRITLRMDDGTTRMVTQDKPPTFRSGDRVQMTDGTITTQ